VQQLSAERQQDFASPISQKAEEANTNEAMRQHMEKKAAQKLFGAHGHQLLLAAVGVILPAESDLVIRESNDPVVGDSHPMGVAG
jgi:hypothetical protein